MVQELRVHDRAAFTILNPLRFISHKVRRVILIVAPPSVARRLDVSMKSLSPTSQKEDSTKSGLRQCARASISRRRSASGQYPW